MIPVLRVVICSALVLVGPGTAFAKPSHEGMPKAQIGHRQEGPMATQRANMAAIAATHMRRLDAVAATLRNRTLIPPAPGTHMLKTALDRPMSKKAAMEFLRPHPSPSPNSKHKESSIDSAASTGNESDPQPPAAQNSGDQGGDSVRIIAATSQNEAAKRICGPEATVCAVWWPTASGDQTQYDSCMNQNDTPDQEMGQTRSQYCRAMWGGDCDGLIAKGTTADLCSLAHGMGVHWTYNYQFGDLLTWGDCTHFSAIKDVENSVAGLALGPPSRSAVSDDPLADTPENSPAVSVCAATLYLLVHS